MKFSKVGNRNLLLLLLLLLALFILDWLTPGYDVWIFYIIPIILASRVCSPQVVMLGATISSGLIVITPFLSRPSPIPLTMVIFNSVIGIAVIWLTVKFLLENRQAEEVLRSSEERFRFLVERVKDYAIILLDQEGRVVTWNTGAQRLMQYEACEIVGESKARFYSPEDQAAGLPDQILDVAQRKGWAESEGWRIRKDGSRFMADVMLTALRDETGRLKGYAKVTHDITQRKEAEEVNRESTARMEFALETGQMGEWDFDLSSHTAIRSLRHDQIFGYQSLLPEWTYEMFLDHVVPEDRDRVDRTFHQAVEAHRRWDFECRIIRADKEMRWIRAQGRPRHDERSQSMRLTGIVQDITEHKQAVDALHRQEVMQQVFEERESIARNLHDGILQSLYAVRLGLEGCRRSLGTHLQAAIPEINARIEDIGLVIAEVRDFMTGQDPAWVRTSDFRKGIEELLQGNRAGDRPVWRLHAPEQDGAACLSSEQIKHLLYIAREAISNVARHASAESCDVTLASTENRLRLTIEDDGVGFAAGTALGSGRGFGNMEARARQIGGTIDIASTPGHGTRITIEITKRKTHVSS